MGNAISFLFLSKIIPIFQLQRLGGLYIYQESLKCKIVNLVVTIVGFTRIAVNFKFHSWFANFKLT